METARTARVHVIWTCIALVVILIASCLTYVFLPKVPGCQRVNIRSASSLFDPTVTESMFRRQPSREHWLLKADHCSHESGHLKWEDEWAEHRNESILDHTHTWIVIRESGVYLVYIQVNFKLKTQINSSSPVELKLLVDFNYGEGTQMFAAAHDTQLVSANTVQDAKLYTFLLMNMKSANQLSVRAFPGELVNIDPRPFSTYITFLKWSDSW
ncbi:uncharacterized protein si:dkey-220k22.3 [Myxocyprinus asiaticus]|uniref:uncharacterized protein si:dkey-220k22.3 n=1 Tax=Myxocyprinus asiaticus TaxID=70543 RepID=UPI002222BE19|nr:uncharacterized protein si:dkey-220k22.3 [Myxocyprinus asiaticus]